MTPPATSSSLGVNIPRCAFCALLLAIPWMCTSGAAAAAALVELVELHGADGQRAFVNPHDISSLGEPKSTDLYKYFTTGSRCVVVTTNGKFLATRESCAEIRALLTTGHAAR